MSDNPGYSYLRVESLRNAISDGKHGLHLVPKAIVTMIDNDDWREFVVRQSGEVVRYESFIDFVTTPPLEGLGTDIETLKRLCSDDNDAKERLRAVTTARKGKRAKSDNTDNISIIKPEHGTSAAYTLDLLTREAPKLRERVRAGEMSANQAAIAAGLRPKSVSVRTDDPQRAARTLARAWGDRLGELIAELQAVRS